MTDEELAQALQIPVELVPKIEAEDRAMCEWLISLSEKLNRWTAGAGPKPKGVIVCKSDGHRREAE